MGFDVLHLVLHFHIAGDGFLFSVERDNRLRESVVLLPSPEHLGVPCDAAQLRSSLLYFIGHFVYFYIKPHCLNDGLLCK